jgi:hypothetical protein
MVTNQSAGWPLPRRLCQTTPRLGAVVVALDLGFGDPGAEFLAGAVLDLDDGAGEAGDVAAVLRAVQGAAFGLGEAGGAEEVDDRGFGRRALLLCGAHRLVPLGELARFGVEVDGCDLGFGDRLAAGAELARSD